jgi:SIR2-like domain/SEC-C motif
MESHLRKMCEGMGTRNSGELRNAGRAGPPALWQRNETFKKENMLNSADSKTFFSIQLLKQIVSSKRPIIWWVGAGASRWAGYESWSDLARRMRSHFYKSQPGFDNTAAKRSIEDERYPDLFQLCKDSNPTAYRRFIADALAPKPVSEVYRRFIAKLQEIHPLFVVTTNEDEALERHIYSSVLIQRNDVSRVAGKLQEETAFICKLHGSISNVETVVFAKEDYTALLNDLAYVQAVKNMFTNGSVVFLGYGVQDEYVLNLLAQNVTEQALFGAGPHFIVTSSASIPFSQLHAIKYRADRKVDHSAAMTILDVVLQAIRDPKRPISVSEVKTAISQPKADTAYYISDFLPPGTWSTSQTLTAKNQESDSEARVTVGLGFTNDEVPDRVSTAFHDLVVGLTCFDRVYLPFNCLSRLVTSLGDDLVKRLLESGVLTFIHSSAELGAFFGKDEWFGSLENITLNDPGAAAPISVAELIGRYVLPLPGKEENAKELFQLIEKCTIVYSKANLVDVPALTRDALLMPQIPKLLGIGDAISPDRLPQWLVYPYLRLGHLVYTSVICSDVGIQAAKLPYGGAALTTAAFNVNVGANNADEAASYVISGRYNTDLGIFVAQNPKTIDRIIEFRSTQSGASLRSEIREALLSDAASEFSASINSGLSRMIPAYVLEHARDNLSALLSESSRLTPTPAVWTNEWQSDAVTRRWRDRSRETLLRLCESRKIRRNDPCPCGSGERLRECCLPPLYT